MCRENEEGDESGCLVMMMVSDGDDNDLRVRSYWLGSRSTSHGQQDASPRGGALPIGRRRVVNRERIVDRKKRSLVQLAVENGDVDLLRTLLKFGSYLFMKDARGYTAFHSACMYERTVCLRMLLEATYRDARVEESPDEILKECINLSTELNFVSCIAVLLEYGCNPFSIRNEVLQNADVNIIRIVANAKQIISSPPNFSLDEKRMAIVTMLRWEKLRILCIKPKQQLCEASRIPGDIWDQIVMYL